MSNWKRFMFLVAPAAILGFILLINNNSYHADSTGMGWAYIVGGIALALFAAYQLWIINRNANSGNQGNSR